MSDHIAIIGLKAADPSIQWPKRGEAETELSERDGWTLRQISAMSRGEPVTFAGMCNGELAVNIMIDDEGFAICLAATGFRISYGGAVFARCQDAMAAAEELMRRNSNWNAIQLDGFSSDQRSFLKLVIEGAEKRGEIMLDKIFPT